MAQNLLTVSTDDSTTVSSRLASSCPPETYTSSTLGSVKPSHASTPSPDYPSEEHGFPEPPTSHMQLHDYANFPENGINGNGQIHTFERNSNGDLNTQDLTNGVSFTKQRPERPGETSSQQGSNSTRRDSRDLDTLVDEPLADDEAEELPETDSFGFFRSAEKLSDRAKLDVRVLRRRETKWIQMLDSWRFYMDEKFDKVRSRCKKGIPPSLRGRAWKYLSGAAYQMEVSNNRFVFDYCDRQPGEPRWVDDINKDLNRQFPEHELFARTGKYGEGGKEDLFRLLKAWTVLHPEEGYCQGQAPIASVLLMHMPLRDAFYVFVQICHKYLPGYYSAGLEAVQIDGDILNQLLKDKAKVSYRHLKKNHVEPVLYMIEWFMCIYCRTLPWPTVLRVWDMFFCEGVKILFKVAIVLFRFGLGTSEQCKSHPDMHSIVMRLRNLPAQVMEEEFLVRKVNELELDDVLMERMHYRAMKLRQMKTPQK